MGRRKVITGGLKSFVRVSLTVFVHQKVSASSGVFVSASSTFWSVLPTGARGHQRDIMLTRYMGRYLYDLDILQPQGDGNITRVHKIEKGGEDITTGSICEAQST